MGLPQVGEVHDGYRYEGGDPNTKASWSWIGDAQQTAPGAGAAGGLGYDAAQAAAPYRKKLAEQRAISDAKRIDGIASLEAEAYGNEGTALRAKDVLAGDTPSGLAPNFRIAMGKALGGTPLARLPGIPTTEQTTNLETLEQLGNQGTLGTVGQLKGPLSDRDVQFLKTLQYSPSATPQQNRRVVEAHQWIAKRQAGYASALRAWTEKLGSPSALNPKGESFDRWWGGYAAKALPPPAIARPKGAPRASPTANAPRKANDPFPGIAEGQVVVQGGVKYRRQGNQMVAVR